MKRFVNIAIAIVILTFSIITGYNITNPDDNQFPKHTCTWEDCRHYGQSVDVQTFTPIWGDEGTDAYYVEIIHVAQPQWTYEQCVDYVFSGVE